MFLCITIDSRGLKDLQQLGYVHRQVPYGEDEKRAKRALYRLADPFLRLWFKAVAAHRGSLRTASAAARGKLLDRVWPQLQGDAWEELCRLALPRLNLFGREWGPAARYWKGNQGEWDAVSTSLDGELIIFGECKSPMRPVGQMDVNRLVRTLLEKPASPGLGTAQSRAECVLFLPTVRGKLNSLPPGVTVVDGNQVFSVLKQEEE